MNESVKKLYLPVWHATHNYNIPVGNIIIPAPTGVIWGAQVNGGACSHETREGYNIILYTLKSIPSDQVYNLVAKVHCDLLCFNGTTDLSYEDRKEIKIEDELKYHEAYS